MSKLKIYSLLFIITSIFTYYIIRPYPYTTSNRHNWFSGTVINQTNNILQSRLLTPQQSKAPKTAKPKDNSSTSQNTLNPKSINIIVEFQKKKQRLPYNLLIACIKYRLYDTDLQKTCIENVIRDATSPLFEYEEYKHSDGTTVLVRKGDTYIDLEKLSQTILKLLNSEDYSKDTYLIEAPITITAPNTDGSLAPLYIEADGSRQLIFLWENGKYTVFKMSGAFPRYNPVGLHKFYYKAEKAWSKYANVWMPYWMAFSQDPRTGARIGLHGLIYYCPNREGMYCDEYIHEPETNLGTPKSMGCLRVSVTDAKYIYSKIRIGDFILVHD